VVPVNLVPLVTGLNVRRLSSFPGLPPWDTVYRNDRSGSHSVSFKVHGHGAAKATLVRWAWPPT
jgi:hypothetical protein